MSEAADVNNMTTNNEHIIPTTCKLETIDDLSPELFTQLLQEQSYYQQGERFKNYEIVKNRPTETNNKDIIVTSLSYTKIDQGVLSQVYRVNIECDDDNNDENDIPKSWIVKLKRPDLELGWMLQCEQAFYYQLVPNLLNEGNNNDDLQELPFDLPRPLSGSSNSDHLIIEYIPQTTCYDLTDGISSTSQVEYLIDAMAAWHAKCWIGDKCSRGEAGKVDDNDSNFIDPPGMGQRLSKLQKEYLFVTKWKDTIDNTFIDADIDQDNDDQQQYQQQLFEFATSMCQSMESLKLRNIHDKVHDSFTNRLTFIHGDYHIANWLFPIGDNHDEKTHEDSTQSSRRRKPLLIDWSTCGYGNPMIDFVFFIVVSTNDEICKKLKSKYLKLYYEALLRYNPSASKQIPNIQKLQEMVQYALLLQWMILVSYDELCRQITMVEPDDQKRNKQLQHFRNVNRRCVLALSNFDSWEDTILSAIPTVTPDERKEAEDFSRNTPLQI